MRILFVSPDIEEKARGINVILKSLINAAKADGHEVGLLVGYPDNRVFQKSETIESKIEHIQLQHYLREGRSSFKYLIPGGYRRRNILKALLSTSMLKTKEIKINPEYLSGNAGLEKLLDFAIQSPFAYQFMVRNYERITRRIVKRAVRKHKIDLVICASPTILRSKDLGRTKLAHFIHDVMPFELMETPPDNNTPNRFASQFYNTAMNSDILFANSKDTAAKIKEVNPKASVHVLYGTASSQPKDMPSSSILENRALTSGKYLLFASTLEKRKNVENLLDAFAMVHDQIGMKLVLIGGPGYGFEDIEAKFKSLAPSVRKNVVFTGYISEADKFTLFRHAFAFVFPSIYEGIGLVIIEAMASNLPVITSRRGALPEAGGDAALYIENPYDTSEIANSILEVYNNRPLRTKMIESGHKMAGKFTPAKFNERFAKALKSLS